MVARKPVAATLMRRQMCATPSAPLASPRTTPEEGLPSHHVPIDIASAVTPVLRLSCSRAARRHVRACGTRARTRRLHLIPKLRLSNSEGLGGGDAVAK